MRMTLFFLLYSVAVSIEVRSRSIVVTTMDVGTTAEVIQSPDHTTAVIIQQ